MVECEHCVLAEKGDKVFEDDKVFAVMSPRQASKGHVLVVPKEHFTILEQVPDFMVGRLFVVANKISTTIFEMLRVYGTNIVVENGSAAGQRVAHFSINVIPRSENDGLGFEWEAKTLSDDEMSTVELQLKEHANNVGGFEKQEKKKLSLDKKEGKLISGDDSYLIKQLRRIP